MKNVNCLDAVASHDSVLSVCLSVSPSSLLINSGEEYFPEVESPSIYEIHQESVKSQ